MKTNHVLFFAVLITASLITQQASAKIWRVNNNSNYNGTTIFGDNLGGNSQFPVFTQINDAVGWGAVSNNDTLYVEGSLTVYNGTTISKSLVIIGPGFFLDKNQKTSESILTAQIPLINFITGSAGSQLIGINQLPHYVGDLIYVNVNDIVIKRCYIYNYIQIGAGLQNITIQENFFTNGLITNAINGAIPYPTDLIFNNNICQKTLVWSGVITQCNNNVFDGPSNTLNLQFLTDDFKNNILKATNAAVNINNGTNQNVSYNIGTLSNQFGTANHNLVVSNISALFVSSTSPDGIYQLKKNSQGSNNGADGTDRGAYGGASVTDPYTLSGLAPIPVIYAISTPGVATQQNGLPVTISARTIK